MQKNHHSSYLGFSKKGLNQNLMFFHVKVCTAPKTQNCSYMLYLSCCGQQTAKKTLDALSQAPTYPMPPVHLSTTHSGDSILSLLMLKVKQESWEN